MKASLVQRLKFLICFPSNNLFYFFSTQIFSSASSGDEVEVNHELEDSTESFENELNKLKENVERRSRFH